MAKSKKNPQHYVDNKKLLEEMKKFKKMCKDAEAVGEDGGADSTGSCIGL